MDEPRYLPIPLFVISDIEKNLQGIFDYGIYCFAKTKQPRGMENVYRQVMYLFYQKKIGPDLKKRLDEYIKRGDLTPIGDYNGFDSDGVEFDADVQIDQLACICEEDDLLNDDLILYWQIKYSLEFMSVNANYQQIINTGKIYDDKRAGIENRFGSEPIAMFNLAIMWDFYNNRNNKTAYEFELLRAFLAIKSLIGRDQYAETTQSCVVMRMTGARNNIMLADLLNSDEIKALNEKYKNRYHRDKLFDNLIGSNFISAKFFYNKRTYLSTTISYEDLPVVVFQTKTKKNSALKHKKNREREKLANAKFKELIKGINELQRATPTTALTTAQ